ncbi:PfkB family carbohydrate kinase [Leptospira alstonii]|uniref:Bifunctional protein RfaE, domain I n=2 Tax=Leptospira alstonii TaxID=28452 RepID=T0H8Z6_9LEPT|nr:HldE family sugar kinase [Leptospira alstonii]EMJ92085.1 putative bifunctional protein RfaE, domain I [Leptospira alstonii serovar Sichuan str. 79601]EQA80288.1 putative bifunctional protein RfaE, domain I [Leptospira alstonii serovar Pingchang str. 80-412]
MIPNSHKIISIADASALNGTQSEDSIILCYGHFNVIHPGHIRFLQYARSLGKKLKVAVLGDQSIPEPQRNKYFHQMERAEGVASLHFVDLVYVLDKISLEDLSIRIRPSVLVLGKEFENSDRQDIKEAVSAIERYNGKVIFHAGEVHYASADLLHGSQQDLESERKHLFLQACKRQGIELSKLLNQIGKFSNSKILVIGDTIVDQYVACDAIGMSAEAPVLVVRELETKEFVGGAGVVAAHVKALGTDCTFLSVVGEDENANLVKKNLEEQGIDVQLIGDSSRPTTFKIRYMVENQKLFRVSRLKEHSLSKMIEDQFIEKLRKIAKDYDGILICDFVYGVVTPRILSEIRSIAKENDIRLFGDLQCSSQVGNVAKFEDFDLLCPTEREARIALSNHEDGVEWIANTLLEKTRSKNLLVKLGADGFIAYSNDIPGGFNKKEHFPALVSNPVDVAGAGDSLLAAIATSMCSGATLMEASIIGACMAALAVQTVGNIPVSHQKLENYIRNLE